MIIRLNSDRMMHTTICAFVCDISKIFLPTIPSSNILESFKIGSQSWRWVFRTVVIPVRDVDDKHSFLLNRTDYYLCMMAFQIRRFADEISAIGFLCVNLKYVSN